MRRTVVGTIGRRTSLKGRNDTKKSSRRITTGRNNKSVLLPSWRTAVISALIVLGAVFLLGVHVYLLRAITSQNNNNNNNASSDSFLPHQQQRLSGTSTKHVPSSVVTTTTTTTTTTVTPLRDVDLESYTVRINTWRRMEQLLVSVEHHASCAGVAQIQIVWCDDVTDPPTQQQLVTAAHERTTVVIERHDVNSLNERFHILKEQTPTMGILSIDDDVLRPCEAIDSGFFKWTRNPHRMVGFDARTHVVHDDGTWSYGYMSTTDKSNQYSISLPRYSFIHRDYLKSYMTDLPRPMFNHVAKVFNCEDIAMSFWISRQTNGSPPLLADHWAMKSMVKLYSPERISGSHNHKTLRDECVDSFAQQLGLKGVLQKGTILHKEKEKGDSFFFECGAEGTKVPPANWRIVDRHAKLQEKIRRWKQLPTNKVVSEVSYMKVQTMRHAYVLGLIEDSTPWKERWHKGKKKKKKKRR